MITSLILSLSSALCPSITPMSNFNTTEYIRSTWFVQEQQINGYQTNNTLNCVAQTLNHSSYHVPFFDGPVLSVYNYANADHVNGEPQNLNNNTLCARQINSSLPSNILNGPCWIPNFLAGPYWVIDAGPSNNNYTWAIISGGSPTVVYPDGNCSTSLHGINGAGLWLVTRTNNIDAIGYYVTLMRERLRELGYTVSQLEKVRQIGCNYTGAFLK
jgi:lipocalin